jgi:quercetin dioxygenase-like cupin family protein
MKLANSNDIPSNPVEVEGTKGVAMRLLIGKPDNAPTFAMRMFEVEPGGHTPLHTHPHEHEVFVLEGHGVVVCEGQTSPIGSEDVIFVSGNSEHCFKNTSDAMLRFLCLVPIAAS